MLIVKTNPKLSLKKQCTKQLLGTGKSLLAIPLQVLLTVGPGSNISVP